MNGPIKPIYLFADSQLLFWKNEATLLLQSLRDGIDAEDPKAAYIGASNDDNPEYYSIFQAAMEGIHIRNTRMTQSTFSKEEKEFLSSADIILLAGGDVHKGWEIFVDTEIKGIITKRYYEGAALMGVSAGAVQLGLGNLAPGSVSPGDFEYMFKFVPFLFDVHDEEKHWSRLKHTVRTMGNNMVGLGLPSGGGMIYYPDQTLEAIRYPAHEFSLNGEKLLYCLVYPPEKEIRECFEAAI